MGIRNKLFVIFLSTFLVLTLAASGFYYLSFLRSLETYLDERQQAQVERLADHLGLLYQQRGGWQFLMDDPRQLKRLYRLAGDRDDERDSRGDHRHLQLLNAQKQRLFGPPAPRKFRSEIPVRSGNTTVGYLTYPDQEAIRDKLDQRFMGRQLRFIGWMLFVGVGLSLLVSWLLARHLVAPILALSNHTRDLQEGHYSARLETRRRDELGTLTEQVNQLAQRLDQGQQARQRWFSDIAHELRTPVAILQGELEAISDGIRPLSPEFIKSLEGEVAQLTHLINDLHDLALADGGNLRYQFHRDDLADLLGEVIDSYRNSFSQQAITLESDLPERADVDMDPVRIRQLLDNLLQNSLKYTANGGSLRITLTHPADHWELLLEDSAPGVPDEALPRLFDHLYRVESSRNRRTGGTGLGLAICQRIVQAHGGTIGAEHSPLGGVRIRITLPGEAS
ncbi:MAG: ATP-binding protein [Alcanivorax sp.]|uniref:ATP-binding protein n=1 Tax=Alcanivorax sp. TaxID=1872427 RepID=UPI003DA7A006